MALGDKLIVLRKKIQLSQEQLAEKMNVTRQTISNWETGQTTPDINQAKELSKIFKVSLDNLLDNNLINSDISKTSNTEKLAGIVIKALKIIGILFLIYIILYFVIIIITSYNFGNFSHIENTSTTIECNIYNKDVVITLYSKGKFNCENCENSLKYDIKNLIDYKKIDSSIDKIADYIKKNNGTCS